MKVLVIGYGSIGKRHIDNLSSFEGVEILVCTKQGYDEFLKQKKCEVFDSIEKCLKEEPQIAIVSNVTSLHVKTATRLAKNGINLFIEKPLSNSMKGVKTLLDMVSKKRLVTQMGCDLRFHPCIRKIKEIISNNEVGRIISARVESSSYLPDWHPYEDYRNSYASRQELGGGVSLTLIHEIDYLCWFFGNVKEVFSITGKFSDLDTSADDLSTMLLRFKNDVIAEVHLNYFQKPSFRSCKIIGTRGTIYWDSDTETVKIYDVKRERWIKKLKLRNYERNDNYLEEMLYFIEHVKRRKKTDNSIYNGVKTLEVVLAAKKASKMKRVVKLK